MVESVKVSPELKDQKNFLFFHFWRHLLSIVLIVKVYNNFIIFSKDFSSPIEFSGLYQLCFISDSLSYLSQL